MSLNNFKGLNSPSSTEIESAFNQDKFEEVSASILSQNGRTMKNLETMMGHIIEDTSTNNLFIMEGQKTNSCSGEDEHYWYDWDIGTIKTGILLDKTNRVIHVSSFNITECWHRQKVLAKPIVTLSISEHEEAALKMTGYSLDDFDDFELTGGWFDAADALEDQGWSYAENNYDDLYFGLNVMNLTAFHYGANLLCRF